MDENDAKWNIDVHKSSAIHRVLNVTSSSMLKYVRESKEGTEIHFDAGGIYMLPRTHQNLDELEVLQDDDVHSSYTDIHLFSNLSQDDCINSASHPKLFTSRYRQSFCVRYYKFQLGLMANLEVAGPMVHD
jgi:hypothetical protein